MNKKINKFQQQLMTGISYMMPIIVIAGVLLGVSSLLGEVFFHTNVGKEEILKSPNQFLAFIAWCNQVAGKGMFSLMYPVLAGYIAFAIADRPALAPGMLGGFLAVKLNAGFIGAVLIGFMAGNSVSYLNKSIRLPREYVGVKSLFFLPVLGSLIVIVTCKFLVGPIGEGFSSLSKFLVNSIGPKGGAVLSFALAAGRAFDFGGPVNKMAGTIGKQLYFDTGYSYIALMLGALVPPIGIGLSTIIGKFVTKKEVFDQQLKTGGLSCFILGLLGISEGVLPFIIMDPTIIPISMIGSGIAGAIGFSLGSNVFPGSSYGFFMWPIVTNIIGFLIALFVGVAIVVILMIIHQKHRYNRRIKMEESYVAS